MEEVWKDVVGFEGMYEVSSLGNVRSKERDVLYPYGGYHRRKSKVISKTVAHKNYYKVTLHKDGTPTTCLVHQLVAKAFIENPQGYVVINHKDECGFNNRVDNLEWCTQKHNINYGTRTKRMKETKGTTTYQYDADWNCVATYPSTAEAARQNNFGQGNISIACRNGHLYKGFYWSYEQL